MPLPSSWFGAPARLLWSFALVLLLPAVAVGWLGLRLIDQDRELESRQRLERRDIAGERIVAGLERAVSASERQLRDPSPRIDIQPDADAVLVTIQGDGLEASPSARLLFTPSPPPAQAEPMTEFSDGEALEFGGAHARAIARYRALANSPDAAIRAGALVHIGRTLRKSGRPVEALAVYEELSRMTEGAVAGLPADAFCSAQRHDGGHATDVIQVVPASGGQPREIFKGAKLGSTIAWAPDGQAVYYGQMPGGSVWRVAATGGEAQELPIKVEGLARISIHPDGSRLAVSSRTRRQEVLAMGPFAVP